MKYRKKRVAIVSIAVVILLAVIGLVIWFIRGGSTSAVSSGQSVYVSSVASIMGLGSGNGMIGRYSGVVEPQKTWKIEVSSDKKVEEIYVKEGDEVKVGDKLFIYSVSDMEGNKTQAEIDLYRINNDIEAAKVQLEHLKKEKASAPAEDQLEYTLRIQTEENNIKKSEYDQKIKQAEIEQLKKSIQNAIVISEMNGVVKSINSSGDDSSAYMTGESEAFMTILETGSFRIKGSVNEQNIPSIVEGQSVIVHSRVDENQIWKGTLTAVDLEKPNNSQSSGYYYGEDSSGESSSSYPFYVELDTTEGLMLGQHVYIEMDYGQSDVKEGLWLDSYYIVQDDEEPYVWAANDKDRIEKRKVTLGGYDEELMKYEITEGLAKDDYIAFPDASVVEGAKAEKNVENIASDGMDNMDGMNSMDGIDSMNGMDGRGNFDAYDNGADEDVLEEDDSSYDESYDEDMDNFSDDMAPGTMIEGMEAFE